ncbi:MAG: cytidine deaminase [Mycoplasmatales bacterium]|nr:cytidine deaminase [Mycoplasmatales bacterium]
MKEKLNKLLNYSYAEYSGVKVAAIVIDKNGNEYNGVNVENIASPSGICAERSAMFRAISDGLKPGDIKEIHLTSNLEDTNIYPCAGCLQVMLELISLDSKIHMYHNDEIKIHSLRELVPYGISKGSFKWK